MSYCIERARDGDRAATAALVQSLEPRLSRMAAYYGRCTGEDSDDLLQEAWVGLLDALPAVDIAIGSPDQYLIQRARWRMLDAVKRARARRFSSLEDGAEERVADPAPVSPESTACVWEFLRKLTRTQRAVLDCLMAGQTWRETGASLGCTSANVAYHVRKIRRLYHEWAA